LKLISFGGSGENGRNCYVVEHGNDLFLLDCGVKREICGGQVGFYPTLTRELVSRIHAVFISHCHEDHTAAIPLLYELGYQGKIYASAETIAMIPSFISKWMSFVKENRGTLPFSDEQVRSIKFKELPPGNSVVEGVKVSTGRSGHVLGGIWFHFDFGAKRVFYSGDMILKPFLLAADIPPSCDGAILNCGYAGKRYDSVKQCTELRRYIAQTLSIGGMVLLPVPPVGRGSDLYAYLAHNLEDVPLYVEQKVLDCYAELLTKKEWLKQEALAPLEIKARVIPVKTDTQRKEVCASATGVYLAGDGMLSTPDSRFCYEWVKGRPESLIIITGHAADGTIAAGVQDPSFRDMENVCCKIEKIIFKAHLDDSDAMTVQDHLKAKNVILFHAEKEKCDSPIALFKNAGVKASCIAWPETVSV